MSGISQAAPTAHDAPAKRLEAPRPPTLPIPGSPLPGSPMSPFCPGLPLRPGTPGKPSLPSGARHTPSSSRAMPSTAARMLVTSQSPGCILPAYKHSGGGIGDGGKHTANTQMHLGHRHASALIRCMHRSTTPPMCCPIQIAGHHVQW